MTRSECIIIRAGGLSIMEQMAMNHPKNQKIYIHHPESESSIMSSGIPWEDKNADSFIQWCSTHEIKAKKINPNLASVILKEEDLDTLCHYDEEGTTLSL